MTSCKKRLYPTKNLGHETQAWYDRHREIHADMGVQVYTEIFKIADIIARQQYTPLCVHSHRKYNNGKMHLSSHYFVVSVDMTSYLIFYIQKYFDFSSPFIRTF
jgi:hypothetical protein